MKRWNALYRWIGILTLSLIIVILVVNVRAQPRIQQDIVLEQAIKYAQSHGLQNRPVEFAMKQTTLAEWFSIVGFQPGDDAMKLGLDSDKAIWIVAMKGEVAWDAPGRQTGGAGDRFDNISIALSADTLEYIGAFAAGLDEKLPLDLQR